MLLQVWTERLASAISAIAQGPLRHQFLARVAVSWRRFAKLLIILLGFAIFAGLQLALAGWISKLWWWYIVALFLISTSVAVAVRSPIVALILWSIISPLGRHFLRLHTESSAIPPITFDFVVVYSLAIILLGRMLHDRVRPRGLVTGEILLLAFTAYVTFFQMLTIRSSMPTEIMRPFIKVLIPEVFFLVVLYFVVKAAIEKRDHIHWFCVGMSVFGFILSLSEIYEHFTGNRWYSLIAGFGIPLAWTDVGKGRATGMFDHAAAPATLIATALFLTYHLAAHTKRNSARLLYYANMISMAVGAYFTYTRNVYLCVLLFTCAMPLLAASKRPRYAAMAAMLLLVIAVGTPIMLSDAALNYRLTNTENVQARLIYASTAVNVVRHFPLFGVGYGNLNEVQKDYVTSVRHWNYTRGGLGWVNISHNTYLTILAEEGLIGALLYMSAIAALLIRVLRVRSKLPRDGFLGKDFASIMFISSTVFLVSIAGASIYAVPYVNFLFWTQFALVVRLEQLVAEEQSHTAEVPDLADSTLAAQRSSAQLGSAY